MTGQLGSMDLVEINPVMDMEILKKSRDMSSPQTAVSVSCKRDQPSDHHEQYAHPLVSHWPAS